MGGEGGEQHSPGGAESLDRVLAHDLTNYLSIIQLQADVLLEEVEDGSLTARLTTIRRQALDAMAMVQTVVAHARGGARGPFEPVDLAGILTAETDRLQSAYRDATVSLDCPEDLRVRADDLVRSIVANLVDNAITHDDSPEPTVDVTAAASGGMAEIDVEDDGPGMTAEVRDALEGARPAPPHSGIHVVRVLVQRYGGDVAVDTGPDGTRVTVRLPLA